MKVHEIRFLSKLFCSPGASRSAASSRPALAKARSPAPTTCSRSQVEATGSPLMVASPGLRSPAVWAILPAALAVEQRPEAQLRPPAADGHPKAANGASETSWSLPESMGSTWRREERRVFQMLLYVFHLNLVQHHGHLVCEARSAVPSALWQCPRSLASPYGRHCWCRGFLEEEVLSRVLQRHLRPCHRLPQASLAEAPGRS